MVTAAVGVAFGVLLIPLLYVYVALLAVGPLALYATTGIYKLPAFFIAYALRRPGAAFLISVLTFLVAAPFSPVGFAIVITGLLHGITCEAGVALATRYRVFSTARLALAGLIAGLLHVLIFAFVFQSFTFALPIVIGCIVLALAGCALAGPLAKWLADSIARTGVLSGTALGTAAAEDV